MDFSICSYNCCSLNKNIDVVRELADDRYDVIFLQETLVTEDRMSELQFIHEDYEVVGVSSVFSERVLQSNAGRSEGGLACMWRRDSQIKIVKIRLEKDFIVLVLEINSVIIVLVNVYIRSDTWETHTLHSYLESLSQLSEIVSSTEFDSIFFIGDFNADPFTGRAWNNLSVFMYENNLRCLDFELLEKETFTFMSYGGAFTKWLDHIVGRNSNNIALDNVKVIHEKYGSDHFPLAIEFRVCNVNIPKINCQNDKINRKKKSYVEWEKLNTNEMAIIENSVISDISRYDHYEFMFCT